MAPYRITLVEYAKKKKPSAEIYNTLLNTKYTKSIAKYWNSWCEKLTCEDSYTEFCRHFQKLYKITQVTKLRNFQYRLLLGKVFTNDILYKWKIKDSTKCEWCEEPQTLTHLLINCKTTKKIWNVIQDLLGVTKLTERDIIFNCYATKQNDIRNLIILVVKYHLFQCKCLNCVLNVNSVMKELSYYYKADFKDGHFQK